MNVRRSFLTQIIQHFEKTIIYIVFKLKNGYPVSGYCVNVRCS